MKPRLNLLVKSLFLFLFATILFYLSISNTKLSSRNINAPNIEETKTQLTIAVYYETKCPDSAKFFNEQLSSALEIFSEIMNVVLIPYGNANVKRKNIICLIKNLYNPIFILVFYLILSILIMKPKRCGCFNVNMDPTSALETRFTYEFEKKKSQEEAF